MEWTGAAARSLYYFERLAEIPHGSTNTKAISDYCMDFAAEHDLDAEQDAFFNVVIRKPATPGYENAPVVLLQGHLDMVAVKDDTCDHDFLKDGLKLMVEGDWLSAQGTTLGADDGIAVAMCLAILEDDTLVHPALEVVLTTDEEIGMIGADAMDMSDLKARYMLNMDCDVEGEVTASCAGGVRAKLVLPVMRMEYSGHLCTIEVSGLAGGHSGVEIHKNRVNAIRMLMEVLAGSLGPELNLVSVRGGAADNAIPAYASAVCVIPDDHIEEIKNAVEAFAAAAALKYKDQDPGINISIKIGEETQKRIMITEGVTIPQFILELPNGVQTMTEGMEDLVETSLNLGILGSEDESVVLDISIRSSREEKKQALMDTLKAHGDKYKAETTFAGAYPGWPLMLDSELQKIAKEAWKAQTGEELRVCAIHAGLECGLFSHRMPGLDIIAYGPTMLDIHSTRERLSLSSTEKCYLFTCELLKRLAEKQ